MIWDARVWSFFIWIISFAMFMCGFVTPYDMPGNREKVPVSFGGNIDPGAPKYGVWKEVPSELSGTFTAVRVCLSLAGACIVVSFIFYILLFKRSSTVVQIVACALNIVAGILNLIAIGVFRAASSEMGEGFYFVASSGGLFIINGVVLVLMPWMEYQAPKWKTAENVPLTQVTREEKA